MTEEGSTITHQLLAYSEDQQDQYRWVPRVLSHILCGIFHIVAGLCIGDELGAGVVLGTATRSTG